MRRCGDAAGGHVAAGAEREVLRSQRVKQPRCQEWGFLNAVCTRKLKETCILGCGWRGGFVGSVGVTTASLAGWSLEESGPNLLVGLAMTEC